VPPGETVHASVVRIGRFGVLIRGASGSGKSSLLLSLLTDAPGAMLVADDRAALRVEAGGLVASVPEAIAGQMEIRGIGIVRRAYVSEAAVSLVVDLLPLAECPRLPTPEERRAVLSGIALPRIFIASGAPDGAARVRAAIDHLATGIYDEAVGK